MNIHKFDNMAEDYAKYRPSYAIDCINFIKRETKLNEESVVADIGSGTGKLSALFLNTCKVFGVEPNNDMRAKAEQTFKENCNFYSVNGTAENTHLSDESVDLAVVGQAFHWFEKRKFLEECQRILKTTKWVAILYNHGDYSKSIIREIDLLSRKYCPRYEGSSGGISSTSIVFENFFDKYIFKIFANNYNLTLEQFIGLNFSASYAPKKDEENYQVYLEKLIHIFEKYSKEDVLTIPSNTICRLGRVKKIDTK